MQQLTRWRRRPTAAAGAPPRPPAPPIAAVRRPPPAAPPLRLVSVVVAVVVAIVPYGSSRFQRKPTPERRSRNGPLSECAITVRHRFVMERYIPLVQNGITSVLIR